jgi:hypothetical protein
VRVATLPSTFQSKWVALYSAALNLRMDASFLLDVGSGAISPPW